MHAVHHGFLAGLMRSVGLASVLMGCLATGPDADGSFADGDEESVAVTTQALAAVCGTQETQAWTPPLWPNGRIPFQFDNINRWIDNPDELTKLGDAMAAWEQATGFISFEPKTGSDTDYAIFDSSGNTCSSPSGPGVGQIVKVFKCGGMDKYLHEIGHLIGFAHQHQRLDRDRYLDFPDAAICQAGIDRGDLNDALFNAVLKVQDGDRSDFGPFDYDSVMLYGTGPDCPATPADCILDSNGNNIAGNFTLSPGDGSAVLEMYREEELWTKFRPIYRVDPGPTSALDTELTSTVDIKGSPALTRWAPNGVAAVVRGSNNKYYYKLNPSGLDSWPTGSWTAIPGTTTFVGDPAVVSWGPGRLDVIGVSTDGRLWHNWYTNNAWGNWHSIGRPESGVEPSAPAIASWGVERLDVFVRSGTTLYQLTYSGNGWPSNWASLGTGIGGKPAAVSTAFGRIELAAVRNGTIQHRTHLNGWQPWTNLGGPIDPGSSGPAISAVVTTWVDVYVKGTNGRLWNRRKLSGSWAAWKDLGGLVTGVPAAATSAAQIPFVVIRTDAHGTHGIWSKSNQWW
jgi:hypothetical protein